MDEMLINWFVRFCYARILSLICAANPRDGNNNETLNGSTVGVYGISAILCHIEKCHEVNLDVAFFPRRDVTEDVSGNSSNVPRITSMTVSSRGRKMVIWNPEKIAIQIKATKNTELLQRI